MHECQNEWRVRRHTAMSHWRLCRLTLETAIHVLTFLKLMFALKHFIRGTYVHTCTCACTCRWYQIRGLVRKQAIIQHDKLRKLSDYDAISYTCMCMTSGRLSDGGAHVRARPSHHQAVQTTGSLSIWRGTICKFSPPFPDHHQRHSVFLFYVHMCHVHLVS